MTSTKKIHRIVAAFIGCGAALMSISVFAGAPAEASNSAAHDPILRSSDAEHGNEATPLGDNCQPHGFGCHSCVADGVWGALWVNADCSRRCDKVCGNERAAAPATRNVDSPADAEPMACACSDQEKRNCSVSGSSCCAFIENGSCHKHCC
jgi:hypothetical protein